jgi:chromosome segregation ATPase
MDGMGHNNPPDPIDEALAPYGDAISEAENWLDGSPVETEDQMKAVDAIIKEIRSAKSDLAKAKKSATAPLHDIWKAEIARWKPTEDDIERRLKGLAAVVDPFKRKLAEEKEAAKRAAYEEARRKEREAEEAARKANASDYEAATEAARLQAEAIEAKKAASAANKDTVKGLRTVTRYAIEDHRAALHWIAGNDRDAITAFIDEYVRRNHKSAQIDGVKVWQEKEAF